MSVIIAGGGIGGLVTGLALHEIGVDVTIYEQVEEIRPLGVGINLLPHAVRVLTQLGLQERLAEVAILTKELAYYNKFGSLIWSEPRGIEAGYEYPQFSIHRGDLHLLLLKAAEERLGVDRIRRNRRVTAFSTDAQGKVTCQFTSRDGQQTETVTANLLIAADGIHSSIRARLYPEEGPPIWNGRVLWRAISEDQPTFLSGRSMIMAGYPDQKFVCYPISPSALAKGRARINWIAELSFDPSAGWRKEDWNRKGDPADFAPRFADWRFDWLDVPALIAATDMIYEYPLVDRNPLDRWTFGPVTLLGDAAHPMYPIGSNGASQAVLDAEAMAQAIAEHGESEAAFQAYEAVRRPPTSAIVLANRGNGPEQVMALAEERAPQGFKSIEDVIPRQELEEIANRYKQIAGFAKDKVNRR